MQYNKFMIKRQFLKVLLLNSLLVLSILSPVFAWYDTNTVGTAPDWHFRVPINIPSTATQNSTIKFDVDFANLLSTLGVTGTLDIQSPRIVRADDATLVSTQEFTDTLYADATDPSGDNKGQIKFIYDDNGANTYYLYFDTVANGTKPVNPNPTINGNFEHSAAGTVPAQWQASTAPAGVTNQNNEVHDTAAGATYSNSSVTCSDGSISNIDDAPNTGRRWYLTGYRDQCETGNIGEQVILKKTLTVPSASAGNLTFYFQLQAFDDINYDYFRVLVNNVSQTASLGIVNSALTVNATKIGRSSGYGTGLVDAGWQLATLDLSSYAGQTITLELATVFYSDNGYRSWVKLDDLEWSVKTATLGTPQQNGPILSLKKTSMVISDPLNSTNPKRIPGSIVEYTIMATNSGTGVADSNTVFITDPVPSNTTYIVNSIQFDPATPVDSGLTADSTNYTYSLDGGATYGTSQSAAVTHIKISPQGVFLANSGSGNPAFTVKYRVKVD